MKRLPERSWLRRLVHDERGNVATEMMAFSPTWLIVFGVFLMNVQLGKNAVQRDMVDHGTAIAADIASKTYCQKQGQSPQAAMTTAIKPLMDLAGSGGNPCTAQATPSGGGSDSGNQQLDVELKCTFPCTVPFASKFMCQGGNVSFEAKQTTVAMGCDGT
jgi:hypothetical protein